MIRPHSRCLAFLPYGTSIMRALRLLRRSCSELPFEFPANSESLEGPPGRDSVSVLLAVAEAEAETEELSPQPLLEFPCPESDESWPGLISLSVALNLNSRIHVRHLIGLYYNGRKRIDPEQGIRMS